MRTRNSFFVFLLLIPGLGLAANWQLKFQLDEDKRQLQLVDLAFTSPETGVAVGLLTQKDKTKPAVLVSGDGGSTWSISEADDVGRMFFLNRNLGWMAGTKGIYRTTTAGKTWEKIARLKNIGQVAFLDEERGWAVGADRQFLQTTDGGRRWIRVKEVDDLKTRKEATVFTCLSFPSRDDVAALAYFSPVLAEDSRQPPVVSEPERPGTLISFQSADRGATWKQDQTSIFGRPAKLITSNGMGLLLLRFAHSFELASVIYSMKYHSEKLSVAFRQAKWIVTDIAAGPDGTVYAVSVERPGQLPAPVYPTKVRVWESKDLEKWSFSDLDYKIQAMNPKLTVSPDGRVWVMTDVGGSLVLRGK